LSAAHNHLIARLPRKDQRRLQDVGEPVQLALSEVLSEPARITTHAYFPTQGFISLVSQVDAHSGLEVGMVGREGMVGAHLVLGVTTSPLRVLVQGPGTAWRVTAQALSQELAQSAAMKKLFDRYVYVLMAQTISSAGCLRFHQIGPRLARWLLMSHDRAQEDSFHVTHEFLAYMLGVRRVGVTVAAGALQALGLISYHRGELRVLDRPGLEAAACSCYSADRQVYTQHMAMSSAPGLDRQCHAAA
jgi:CRP-like cAMP-binding protein